MGTCIRLDAITAYLRRLGLCPCLITGFQLRNRHFEKISVSRGVRELIDDCDADDLWGASLIMSHELVLLQPLDNVAATARRGKGHSRRQRGNSHQIAALKWTPCGSCYPDKIIRQAHRKTVLG